MVKSQCFEIDIGRCGVSESLLYLINQTCQPRSHSFSTLSIVIRKFVLFIVLNSVKEIDIHVFFEQFYLYLLKYSNFMLPSFKNRIIKRRYIHFLDLSQRFICMRTILTGTNVNVHEWKLSSLSYILVLIDD